MSEMGTDTIQGHDVTAIFYAYSNAEGKTVDASEFIEVRDGKYIFYRTAAYRESSGPELEAVGTAIVSLEFSADAYGESDAVTQTKMEAISNMVTFTLIAILFFVAGLSGLIKGFQNENVDDSRIYLR